MTTDTRPPLDLDPDAPHSPERTRQLADVAADAIRTLNYATMSDRGGLEYPGDAYELLGALVQLTQRLPQLSGQVAAWLDSEQAAGHLGEVPAPRGRYGGDSARAVAAAGSALAEAGRAAARLSSLLGEAQAAIAGVEYVGRNDDVPCPDCDGRGLADNDEPCLNCAGTGWEGGPE